MELITFSNHMPWKYRRSRVLMHAIDQFGDYMATTPAQRIAFCRYMLNRYNIPEWSTRRACRWPERTISPDNLYPNPMLFGGSDIVADVYTSLPTSHSAGIFAANPCDADYTAGNDPAYRFRSTGNSRFVLTVDVNKASGQLALPRGRRYAFVADTRMGSVGAASYRGLGLAGYVGGAKLNSELTSHPTDGEWRATVMDFELPADGLSGVTLRHGMGVSVAVPDGWYECRGLSLYDAGPIVYPDALPDEPDLRNWLHNPATTYIYDGRNAHYRVSGTTGHVFEYELTKDGSWDWAAGIDFEIIVRQTFGTAIPDFEVAPTDGAIAAGAVTTSALVLNEDVVITGTLVWDNDPTAPRIRIHGNDVGADNTHVWIRSIKTTPNVLQHNGVALEHNSVVLTHKE